MNNIRDAPKLPFITLFGLKILVDSGACGSIMNPSVAYSLFSDCLFKETFCIQSVHSETLGDDNVRFPIFSEHDIDLPIKFRVMEWHKYFDALIGSADFKKLGAKIDYATEQVTLAGKTIPFFFHSAYKQKEFKPAKDANTVTIPVNINHGDVYVPQFEHNGHFFSDAILHAENFQVSYPTEVSLESDFKNPIFVEPLEGMNIESVEINSISDHDIQSYLRMQHMNDLEREATMKICSRYADVFYYPGCDLSFTSEVKHFIRTTDENPVYQRNYRYPPHLKEIINEEVEKLLSQGIITHSESPYCNPVWIVPKKLDASGQKKWRLVIDFRQLNQKTIGDKYPLPRIEEILDNLGRCQYFSTLDLAQGFHQIEMDPKSVEKTAFSVDNRHLMFKRLPFGLKNAPGTFQRVMDNVLRPFLYRFCFVYIDDIIIYSKSMEEHVQHLNQVLQRLREVNLKIQLDKTELFRKEVAFLGHVVSQRGIEPNPEKIKAVKEYPIPTTSKEIKQFLGLAGFYRKFIKDFAKIAFPMTRCLKKGTKIDIQNTEYKNAFETLKTVLINAPVLTYPNFEEPFTLTTDGSEFAIGSVLSQKGHPIAYYSRTLKPAERKYSTIERELLAIVDSCKHFKAYLWGRHFHIETDHRPLQWLFTLKDPSSRLYRWKIKLKEFDFDIKYVKGKTNYVADALSRIEINAKIETESNVAVIENDNYQNEADTQTVHSNQEDPIFTLKMTERNLNQNRNQIIIKYGDSRKLIVQKLFKKQTRYIMVVTSGNFNQDLTDLLLKVITPANKYAVYFSDFIIEVPFIRVCQKLFTSELIMIRTQTFLEDVEDHEKQKQLILQYHSVNHNGITETVEHLQKKYFWPHLREHVRNLINQCNLCQRNKYERHPNQVENQGPIVADHPFAQVHIDTFHFEQERILTILDVFSKYGQAYILPNATALAVLNQLQIYFSHHGLPKKITHDQGGEFENNIIKEYCKASNIEYHATTPLNSTSNSPVERLNSTLLEKLRISRDSDKFSPLSQLITNVVMNYNSSIHTKTKKPPFNVLYGPYYDALDHMFSPSPQINEYIQRQNNQLRVMRESNPEPNTSTFKHSYKIGEVVYVTNPLTRNRKSKNLYNEGTILKIEGNKIFCKMKNGKTHTRNFRDIKPKRKTSLFPGSSSDKAPLTYSE